MSKKIIDPTRVTTNIAEVGFVLSIAFFIRIVVTLMKNDDNRARFAASMENI
jgi:hypothetical protein